MLTPFVAVASGIGFEEVEGKSLASADGAGEERVRGDARAVLPEAFEKGEE